MKLTWKYKKHWSYSLETRQSAVNMLTVIILTCWCRAGILLFDLMMALEKKWRDPKVAVHPVENMNVLQLHWQSIQQLRHFSTSVGELVGEINLMCCKSKIHTFQNRLIRTSRCRAAHSFQWLDIIIACWTWKRKNLMKGAGSWELLCWGG